MRFVLRISAIIIAFFVLLIALVRFVYQLFPQLDTATHSNPPRHYSPTSICDDAWKHDYDYTQKDIDHFDIELHDGCFSAIISLPERFRRQYWHQPVNPDQSWWFAIWFVGGRPQGPFGPNAAPVFDHAPMQFRLQGHGTIRYYTNEPPLGRSSQ